MSEKNQAGKANAGVVYDVFRFMASVKLALLLMGVIVVASVTGTICESRFNADVAREYIYNASWFNVWMGILCLNLFCAAAIRYPWKSHQIGFAITHAGIITLLIGSMIDRKWGIEGYMHLNRGENPSSTMELNKQELRVYVSGCEEYGITTLQTKTMTSPRKRKFAANSPAQDVKVEVVDVKTVVAGTDMVASKNGKPAVRLSLSGPMMGRNDVAMFLGDDQSMGPAVLKFAKGLPPSAATAPTAAATTSEMVPRRERFYVFAKNSEPMGRTIAGAPTGLVAKLELDSKTNEPKFALKMLGKDLTFSVKEIVGKESALEGLPDWKLNLIGYYPNFRMVENNQPGTADDKPENPAILFEVKGPLVKADVDMSASPHAVAPHAGVHDNEVPNSFALYLGDDNKLRYVIKSKKTGDKSGEITPDQPVPLGWAPGAEATLLEFLPSAQPIAAWRAVPKEFDPQAPNPGLLCRVTADGQSREVLVGKTSYEEDRKTKVTVGKRTIELAFENSTEELPFAVSLLNFHAPRDEGMESSMSFMSFESTLGFEGVMDSVHLLKDSKTAKALKAEVIEGGIVSVDAKGMNFRPSAGQSELLRIPLAEIQSYEKSSHKISMNRPTMFPVTWYGPWLGTDYKFSQAGHNFPNNPDYSGVQVLRDPGWLPEWFGSLLISFGIFTMFYLKPYFRRAPATAAVGAAKKNPVASNVPESGSLQSSGGE